MKKTHLTEQRQYDEDMRQLERLRVRMLNTRDPRERSRLQRRMRSVSLRCVAPTIVKRFAALRR